MKGDEIRWYLVIKIYLWACCRRKRGGIDIVLRGLLLLDAYKVGR